MLRPARVLLTARMPHPGSEVGCTLPPSVINISNSTDLVVVTRKICSGVVKVATATMTVATCYEQVDYLTHEF